MGLNFTGKNESSNRPITLDLSMLLVNRTAVREIGKEIYNLLPIGSTVRTWRVIGRSPWDFGSSPLMSNVGKALGRFAFKDLDAGLSAHFPWPRPNSGKMLFLDPVFCRRTEVRHEDLIICHDVGPIEKQEFYDAGAIHAYDEAYRKIQRVGAGLVFVSEYSKKAFLRIYPGNYRRTDVIPLFLKSSLSLYAPPEKRLIDGRYFLMVGNLERRKNYLSSVDAFVASRLGAEGIRLVIVGPRGNIAGELEKKSHGNSDIVRMGYVNDEILRALYEGAEALFFPSLLEGFGVPALEAPQLGILPIVSRGTALQEVVGPDGILVDPDSVVSMTSALIAVAEMTADEKMDKIRKIREHQERYSLEKFRKSWKALIENEARM
jgi:glycosyltransferase involved in cell wall biosynthesis